ncbi:MAG: pyruvate ferredoxin oxidoreductase [Deltaproteobacteria bacterium]|mgnify:FL=1|jgi:pyruvate ferredoxin oxidoreductase alpha subunit|nr:pyruvate ferredoxin oxidoreductase [Deltaproteobacteria bacterium]PNV85683.1 MAG: pyruvate ferredoxin oxidoreductase [Desulfobacteraceae bacterium]MDH3773354.1 pyruvate ferredoxin oxidoreductase [Deltaproteobacteria bacterium]MDH3800968.1 pyruvate ferredoxin oxidoreductase [Deltaproteobacteria bacterium]MDH3850539.1 pyruvate ferredoxin oxidoreductase [Deltaproteobacteria bacterium]
MLKQIEGSHAVAHVVAQCRPNVISAYPITPQTHIVEELAEIVGAGQLDAEFVNVESEFSAASVVLGASAAGARAYTATSSQGLLLMSEVIYCIAGMRLPIVMTCANRAISAPLSIWNDQQDSMAVRDAGWIQLHAEDNQEASDLHVQAFKIAERTFLPVMVCMDGFILTHAFEPVDIPEQKEVDDFLPTFKPRHIVDPRWPRGIGLFADPRFYMETRYILHRALEKSEETIKEVSSEFAKTFGRESGGFIKAYKLEEADVVVISMGSVVGTIKELIDQLEEEGKKVGLLQICSYRPFPRHEVYRALKDKMNIVVLEKCISLGRGGILASDVRWSFPRAEKKDRDISSFVAGLGGRNISIDDLRYMVEKVEKEPVEFEFLGLKEELIAEKDM